MEQAIAATLRKLKRYSYPKRTFFRARLDRAVEPMSNIVHDFDAPPMLLRNRKALFSMRFRSRSWHAAILGVNNK